ncbi:MAG: helix-turn-helix domain-containing protein [Clostridiales Family XIII bacterium]|jgi:transcriptional regulator with XRE-family HTH domain|nr:helix-turn-helix domain-containing protein [Clostridiales Family XIII bacterium]
MESITAEEKKIGGAIRQFRIRNGYSLDEVADKASLSPTSVRSLELGRGSTVSTMLKVLAAIDEMEIITEWMARSEAYSPILEARKARMKGRAPQRVRRGRQ